MSMTSRNWVLPPKPKPGRKPIQSTSEREARNRATQRAFRERRKALVSELREELCEMKAEFADKERKMTRRIQDLEQQLSASQKRCAEFAIALGRSLLDESNGNSLTEDAETLDSHQDRQQGLGQTGYDMDIEPDYNHSQDTQHQSSGGPKAIPRNIPSSSAHDVAAQSPDMNQSCDDAPSFAHPELFDDPLLENLSLSSVSSTYGYLHPGIDDVMSNNPLELDEMELRQLNLPRSSFS